MSLYKARYEQVIKDPHFAAFILRKKKCLKFIKEKYGSDFLVITLKILKKIELFHNENICIYCPTVVKIMSDCK